MNALTFSTHRKKIAQPPGPRSRFYGEHLLALHRDARYFPEPEKFLPERWLGSERTFSQRLYYFPFGVGPRICIGEEYGWMNGMLIMATLARMWRLRLAPNQRIELLPRTGLGAKYGIKMMCEARASE